MKFLRLIIPLLLIFSSQIIFAQQDSATGKVAGNKNQNKQESEFDDADKLLIDFRNFKYPDRNGKEFKLTNGTFLFTNPKTKMPHSFQFRRVYYFDVTDDTKKDAIVHLLADNCESCEMQSVFYLFTAKNKQLQPIWKIFTGAGAKCGLKDISFKLAEIILETFGNCSVNDSTVIEDELLKKNDVATKFIFHFKDGQFIQSSKENSPFPQSEIFEYRTQIKFGD